MMTFDLIDCELGTLLLVVGIQLSVPGGKYRTNFPYFLYLIVSIRYFSVF